MNHGSDFSGDCITPVKMGFSLPNDIIVGLWGELLISSSRIAG